MLSFNVTQVENGYILQFPPTQPQGQGHALVFASLEQVLQQLEEMFSQAKASKEKAAQAQAEDLAETEAALAAAEDAPQE